MNGGKYTYEGLHPNELGAKKIAMYMYPKLEEIYKQYYLVGEIASVVWSLIGKTKVDGAYASISFTLTGVYSGKVYNVTSNADGTYNIPLAEDKYNITASGYKVNTTWSNAVWIGLDNTYQDIIFTTL